MMYTRKCRDCGIKYPVENRFVECHVCGKTTAHLVGAPDEDWADKVAALMVSDAPDDKTEKWRLEKLLEAGYDVVPASLLALDRDVNLHRAVDLAKNPRCGPELAYRIVS